MAIKKYNPTSPGRRFMSVSAFEEITSTTPENHRSFRSRNQAGEMCLPDHSKTRGGGAKRKYRIIDFKRDKDGVPAKVATIEYDQTEAQTSRCSITLTERRDTSSLLSASKWETRLFPAQRRTSSQQRIAALSAIPVGTMIHNVEVNPAKARSS